MLLVFLRISSVRLLRVLYVRSILTLISRLAFTAGVRQTFDEHPEYFDPRQYCGKAREYMEDLYKHKITDVLGSDNKLVNCD